MFNRICSECFSEFPIDKKCYSLRCAKCRNKNGKEYAFEQGFIKSRQNYDRTGFWIIAKGA